MPARRHFEIFVILSLAYLAFTAIAFLAGARSLVYPRFILDPSLGVQAERARGPFLQAVANGLSLNLLGILAIALQTKKRLIVRLLWLAMPVAVLATMTRAVWISFTASTIALGFRLGQRNLRRFLAGLSLLGLLIGLVVGLNEGSLVKSISDRTSERGPVNARLAVYEAGWAMFQERPLAGWTANGMYAELARRMEGYHLRNYYVHNTYLSLLIEFGIPGLALYAILFFNLFRLGRRAPLLAGPDDHESSRCVPTGPDDPLTALQRVWPILLCVYLFNAFFVDMAYQFVTGLMFTVGGMLCSTERFA